MDNHRAVLLVYTDVEPERDDEFNRWYDDVHLADVLAVPGMVAARRYRLSGPAPSDQPIAARYLVIYELDTDDVEGVRARIAANRDRITAAGRMWPDLRVMASAIYAALGPSSRPSAAAG
jgi:hypothetical protein